jgi:hypothetical protein
MNAVLFADVETISLKANRVFGTFVASLKDHPPTAIHVRSNGFLDSRAVKCLYRFSSPGVIGAI